MEHKRAAHRVAIIGEVHKKPGRAGAYQSDCHVTVPRERHKAFTEGGFLGGVAVPNRTVAFTEHVSCRRMGIIMLTGGQEIARAFRHMSPHLEHSQRRYGAERQQEAPHQVFRHAGRQKRRCQKRSDNKARSLHREDQRQGRLPIQQGLERSEMSRLSPSREEILP
jgi:hypothetical protein